MPAPSARRNWHPRTGPVRPEAQKHADTRAGTGGTTGPPTGSPRPDNGGPLNGFVAVIGMDPYPTRASAGLRNGTQDSKLRSRLKAQLTKFSSELCVGLG